MSMVEEAGERGIKERFEVFIARILYERGEKFFAHLIIGVSAAAAASVAFLGYLHRAHWMDFLTYALLIALGPYGFYRLYYDRIIDSIEKVFPDFLRDLAENRRSGMSLVESLKIQARGNYGKLTPYVQRMAAAMAWGVTFYEVLDKLAQSVNSSIIRRAIVIIREGAEGGGEFSDVLMMASRDIRGLIELELERRSQMIGYLMTMYISFGVFLFVILMMIKFFFPGMGGHLTPLLPTASLPTSTPTPTPTSPAGKFTIHRINLEELLPTLYVGSLIQGIGAGTVGGLVYEGRPSGAIKHIFIMVIIAYLVFKLAGAI